jgi:hypothetical protein
MEEGISKLSTPTKSRYGNEAGLPLALAVAVAVLLAASGLDEYSRRVQLSRRAPYSKSLATDIAFNSVLPESVGPSAGIGSSTSSTGRHVLLVFEEFDEALESDICEALRHPVRFDTAQVTVRLIAGAASFGARRRVCGTDTLIGGGATELPNFGKVHASVKRTAWILVDSQGRVKLSPLPRFTGESRESLSETLATLFPANP